MTTLIIIQARLGSTRLPGKVLKKIEGTAAIDLLLQRLSKGTAFDKIVVATSDTGRDDPLAAHLQAQGVAVFRGSETDVLSRYAGAAAAHNADVVVRVTGDCPLIDPAIVDATIRLFHDSGADYASNVDPASFPDGTDTEVFTRKALDHAQATATEGYDREHVTPLLRRDPSLKRAALTSDTDHSAVRFSLDEAADLAFLRSVFAHFAPRRDMGWQEVIAAMAEGKLKTDNQSIVNNEGAAMGTGQKLWKRARQIIPGGNMLLSKRAEMFLPDLWPAYFKRTQGCTVWDMDGTPFTDMSLMAVGTNTLGYSHPEVDEAVMQVVRDGNLATLNAPEEVWLAERLIDMHPWSGMVRFTRSGGEANAVAIRIARAASGRDGVAICGYHGWHDWYLSANLARGDKLAGHLLPGLEPKGVPQDLAGSTHPFFYNDFEALERLVNDEDIGVIKMEVMRNEGPKPGYLEAIRKLATDKGIVLVFDECTSGFRESFGGLHLNYGVDPDMIVLGKTLGNGYACNAVLGREDVMQAAQSTFISSTFWTERIGSAAALKTLDVMERERSWEGITTRGKAVVQGWKDLAARHDLPIAVAGLPSIASFSVQHADALALKTLMTQEMLAKGWLASTACYSCLAHDDDTHARYFEALDPVFALMADCVHGRADVHSLLKGPIAHGGFKRLN